METPILQVHHLQTSFFTDKGEVRAVDGVNFTLAKGRTLGIVGESGSGKSITSLSILRLIPTPPGNIVGGKIIFKGENLLEKTPQELANIRGKQMAMIFQEPMTSLNPVLTVGKQIAETIRTHQKLKKREAWEQAVEMLRLVGIPSPEERAKQYPFEFSGGMRQRVMIAMALSCHPELLIADEPTTALDVTVQAQILELLKQLQKELGMAIIFITHDLGVVAEFCDQVAVMYAGQIVELSDVDTLFINPKHPYTKGLLRSLPRVDTEQEELYVLQGSPPNPYDLPQGCRFAPRCPLAEQICEQAPELVTCEDRDYVAGTRKNLVRCWLYTEEWPGRLDATKERPDTQEVSPSYD